MRDIDPAAGAGQILPPVNVNRLPSCISGALRWLMALASLTAPAFAQLDGRMNSGTAPPPVVSREIAVRTGETVAIPLGIHGSRGGQMEFLIRSNPKLGHLGKVVSTGQSTGTVPYTAGEATGVDQFTYAARGRSGGASAPGAITIRITQAPMLPARLVVPEALTFPRTITGGRSTAALEIKNLGGSPAEGRVIVQPPFRIAEGAEYRIEAGASKTITVTFEPEAAGKAAGVALVARFPQRTVALAAEAFEPLTFSPAVLELRAPPGSQTRKAILRVSNHTGEERIVRLTAGSRLLVSGTLALRPRETGEIPVFAEPGTAAAFDDKLELASDGWSATIPVRTAAMGALLQISRIEPPRNALAGRPAEARLVLSNNGSSDINVTVQPDPPLEAPGGAILVPAGKTTDIPLRLPRAEAGDFAGKVAVTGDGRTLRSPVQFTVAAAPPPAPKLASHAPPPETGAAPPAPPPAPGPAESVTPKRSIPPTRAEHPNSLGRLGQATSPTTAVIEWPADLGETTGLKLQRRELSLGDGGALVESWVDGTPAVFSARDGKMRAEISNLPPARLHTLRVVDSDGDAVLTVSFTTPAKPPLVDIGWRSITLILLGIGLAALAWWKWKTRVRSGW